MSAEKPGTWPWTHEEFEGWVERQTWIDAASETNPHSYCLKRRSPSPREFERAVLHLREFGTQEIFGGATYTYYEAAGHKLWTMQAPLEHTILVNRKSLSSASPEEASEAREPSEAEEEQPKLPELFTTRYLATDVLASGLVVPVRISMFPPEPLLGELPYPLEHGVRALMPERSMYGEWDSFSPRFWEFLDHSGPGKIAALLSAISARHDGRALALLCFEDLQRAQRCHRTIVATWWFEQTGQKMLELTNAGEVLALEELPRQVQPVRPQEEEEQRSW
jgi:hypothetical protein